jgi:hypothetical protein
MYDLEDSMALGQDGLMFASPDQSGSSEIDDRYMRPFMESLLL